MGCLSGKRGGKNYRQYLFKRFSPRSLSLGELPSLALYRDFECWDCDEKAIALRGDGKLPENGESQGK